MRSTTVFVMVQGMEAVTQAPEERASTSLSKDRWSLRCCPTELGEGERLTGAGERRATDPSPEEA